MSIWRYKQGTIINGTVIDTDIYRQELPCCIDDVNYGTDIFTKWTKEQLAEKGIKEVIEESVKRFYNPGVPEFTEDEFYIHKTFPNQTVDVDRWKNELRVKIQSTKNTKRDSGFVVDGILYDCDISARTSYSEIGIKLLSNSSFSTPWKASDGNWVVMDATLFAKVTAAGEQHIQDAFIWQATMEGMLDAANTEAELLAVEAELTK